jgi:hypothetical protein
MTSTCPTLVAFLQTIVPPPGTWAGFGLNAPLPEELTMLIVVLAGAWGGGAGVDGSDGEEGLVGAEGVAAPPPQLIAHSTINDTTMERRSVFVMTGRKAKPVPRKDESSGADMQGAVRAGAQGFTGAVTAYGY